MIKKQNLLNIILVVNTRTIKRTASPSNGSTEVLFKLFDISEGSSQIGSFMDDVKKESKIKEKQHSFYFKIENSFEALDLIKIKTKKMDWFAEMDAEMFSKIMRYLHVFDQAN